MGTTGWTGTNVTGATEGTLLTQAQLEFFKNQDLNIKV